MASSRKSSRSKSLLNPPFTKGGSKAGGIVARVAAQLKDIVKPRDRLVVGLSGGVDSIVLLDCLKAVARKLRFRLSALHVNHQLSPNAAHWAAFCRRLCRERGIPFDDVKVHVRRGDGPEAAARAARYEAYARQDCDYVVLAHHRDDQVETFLLQLLRGAGVKGLAAMPLVRKAKGKNKKAGHPSSFILHPSILRPLLDVTRAEIEEYARKRRLKWVEDESNQDIYFQRNFLRHEVLPVLARRFPAYRTTIVRSAGHLAEAARLLDEVAAADGRAYSKDGALAVEALRRLPVARARNLLRWFLAGHGVAMPTTERLEQALRQALTAKQDAQVLIELDGAELRRYENRMHVVRALKAPRQYSRPWLGEKRLDLLELGGALTFARRAGNGISLARLRGSTVTVRLRRGGERLRPDCRRPTRSLKNLLQEARMPPWQRERLPLIFCGEELVWAAGIGVDCAFQAEHDEPAARPEWRTTA